MKKILLLLASILMFAIPSCNKTEQPTKNFVGSVWQFTNKIGYDVRLHFVTDTEVKYTFYVADNFKGSTTGTYSQAGEQSWDLNLIIPERMNFNGTGDLSMVRAWIVDGGKMRVDMVRGFIDLTRIE